MIDYDENKAGKEKQIIWTCAFLSVRKLKNQPSNKLLLSLFCIQTVKEGNIRE